MWTVYILQCRDGTLYTGITDNLPAAWPPTTQAGGPSTPGAAPRWSRCTRSSAPTAPPLSAGSGPSNPSPASKSWPCRRNQPPPDHPPRHRRMPQAHGANFSGVVQSRCRGAQCAPARKSPPESPPNFPAVSLPFGGTKPPYRMFCFPYTAVSDDLPNKSLCVPVRAKVSTSTSSSMR